MKNMKAFVRVNAESQEVKLIDTLIPTIEPDGVLVKVEAFGVGIHDRYFIPEQANFPYTIGSEGAGIITELGNEVSNFSVGDRVIFSTVLQPQGGSWAEYAYAKQTALIPLPKELTFAQGATVPIAGKTALESMRALNLKSGDSLFIAGASGAIGTLVIQLAASASEKNHTYMKSLGANLSVDYSNSNWKNEVKKWSNGGVSAALAIQPNTGSDSMEVVNDGGRVITVSGDSAYVVPARGITVKQMGHHINSQQKMIELVDAMAKGEIKIVIEKEYPFERAIKALEKTETRHARGKLVVKL